MRLKAAEGPLAAHSQHNEILNSPKRINTLQNSRYVSGNATSNLVDNTRNNTNISTNQQRINNVIDFNNYNKENFFNRFYNNTNGSDLLTSITPNLIINNGTADVGNGTEEAYEYAVDNLTETQRLNGEDNDIQELQWYNATDLTQPRQKLTIIGNKNTSSNNRNLETSRNINSCNLATQLRIRTQQPVTSEDENHCAEPPSPDDVLIRDDLDRQASGYSSTSVSPRDEDKAFEVSDSAESSDEGNDEIVACQKKHSQKLRCIVNPNYPGFQHLAHTLIDGYTEENLTVALDVDNNANNNNPEDDFQITDKFDSINRLDSIENIQKVFHDKSLDIQPIELGDSPSSTAQELNESTGLKKEFIISTNSVDQNDLFRSTTSIEQEIYSDNNVVESTIILGQDLTTNINFVDSISLEQDLTTDNNLIESSISLDQDLTSDTNLVESTIGLELVSVSDKSIFGEKLETNESNSILGDNNKAKANNKLNSVTFDQIQKTVLVEDFHKVINDEVNVDSVKNSKFNDKVLESVVGNLSKEIEDELDKVGLSAEQFEDQLKELELVADKLTKITDASPSVLKKYFETNCNEPFEKVYQINYLDDGFKSRRDNLTLLNKQSSGNLNKNSSIDLNEDLTQPTEPNLNKHNSKFNEDKTQVTKTFSQNETHHEPINKPKEIVRPSTLNLPAKHIKRPSESSIFSLDDESAEDLKAEQLIMSAKLIDISRTPTAESNNDTKIVDLRELENTNASVKINAKTDNIVLAENVTVGYTADLTITNKMVDAALSSAKENIPKIGAFKDINNVEKNYKKREWVTFKDMKKRAEQVTNKDEGSTSEFKNMQDDNVGKFVKEDSTKNMKEKDTDSSALSKKAKFSNYIRRRIDYGQQLGSLITFPRRESAKNRDPLNRRSVPMVKKRGSSSESLGGFDVYNIETAMPKIDLEAIESHLKAAREEERRRRTDREEIRRRLAMGPEDDYYNDRPGRKPSLQSRLQSGMNLQICFMNETVSDTDSPTSETESPFTKSKQPKFNQNMNKNGRSTTNNINSRSADPERPLAQRPATLPLMPQQSPSSIQGTTDADFFTKQARLQTEARMALAQAKEMARMQMEIEKQRQKKSPITEMVRNSLEKVGIPFPEEKRRLSRQILTEMNVAQLQVIVNDLHTQIETLNENLVKFLMDRDDLHMEQDSMLVDIEDLTRYLTAKEQVLKDHSLALTPQNNNHPPPSPAPPSPLQTALNNTVKPHLHRIASLVKK